MKNRVRNGVEEKLLLLERGGNGETATFPSLSPARSLPLAFVCAHLCGEIVIVHSSPSLPMFKSHLHVQKERAVSIQQRAAGAAQQMVRVQGKGGILELNAAKLPLYTLGEE